MISSSIFQSVKLRQGFALHAMHDVQMRIGDALFGWKMEKGRKTERRMGPFGCTWFRMVVYFCLIANKPAEWRREAGEVVGSITSRCSGNEPELLPWMHGWTREDSFVSLNQSDNCPQIFVGHKLSRQFGLRPVMTDDFELMNGIRENFRDS